MCRVVLPGIIRSRFEVSRGLARTYELFLWCAATSIDVWASKASCKLVVSLWELSELRVNESCQ